MINPFSDLGKETQNPFLDTRIRIWIFPKKRTLIYNIGTHSVRELFCSCQEEVQKWLLNERACTKVHYWDVVYLSSVENSKSIGF